MNLFQLLQRGIDLNKPPVKPPVIVKVPADLTYEDDFTVMNPNPGEDCTYSIERTTQGDQQ